MVVYVPDNQKKASEAAAKESVADLKTSSDGGGGAAAAKEAKKITITELALVNPDKSEEHRCCCGFVPYKYLALFFCVLNVGCLLFCFFFMLEFE